MSATNPGDEFKNPKKKHSIDKDREDQMRKAAEIYSAWRGAFVNTPARKGDEIITRLFALRDLMEAHITNEEVLALQLEKIDHSLKAANKKWPKKGGKAARKRKQDDWQDRVSAKRKKPGGGDPARN